MAKSTTQRVNEYRARLALRASYYEALNDHRITAMRLDIAPNTPEERAVREMCLNYPDVLVPPSAVGLAIEGGVEVCYLDENRQPRLEDMAAAYAALREITSAPVRVSYVTASGGGSPLDAALRSEAARVTAEVKDLRAAGLWFRK